MKNSLSEIDIKDDRFEIFDNISGNERMFVPLMNEYPNPQNQFDIQMGVDGETTEVITNAVQNAGKVLSTLAKTETEKELKVRCGRRPILAKNRATYDACAETFFAQNNISRTSYQPYLPTGNSQTNKMSTGAIVGIVLGGVAVAIGGYFLFKSMTKKG